jgi:large subunit ribosomal protein L10
LPLTRERKEDLVAEYTDLLQNSRAVIFSGYRGLTNQDMNQLRRNVTDARGIYRVAKLTLLQIALERAGYPVPEQLLSGEPVAVGFCLEEIPSVAKAITEFADEHEMVEIYGGVMPEREITAAEIETLADLPPLDVLRAQIVGMLDAPAANLVGVLQAGVAQVINVVNAYAESGEGAGAAA